MTKPTKKRTLRLILGDQLNSAHSWFNKPDPEVDYVLMEMGQELTYVTHHIQKITAFFLAMRNFKNELEEMGHELIYFTLDHPENTQDIIKNLTALLKNGNYSRFEYQLPDEYRLDQQLISFCRGIEPLVKTGYIDTEHFLTSRRELIDRFGERKSYLMESFYRQMRKDHDILMEGKEPEGGMWNFDKENRKSYDHKTPVPKPIEFHHSGKEIRTLLDQKGIQYIGWMVDDQLNWPISRKEALESLNYFTEKLLTHFGTFEDAMDTREKTLFHSRLSFALNIKLLSPKEVIQRVIQEFRAHPEKISLPQVEGFVRQILGWREFMRCQYWIHMPGFAKMNFLENHRALPSWYWTGETKMNCLQHAIGQSLEMAYAHHIQRLMITGSFALLAGVDPGMLDEWYLGIYIDAIEWVEITNTRGMSQFADGGIIGTKPYVSGANYISKMSNYCQGCTYDPKKRHGENACPFNSLYWNFYLEKEPQLKKNQRVSLVYRNLEKMEEKEIASIKKQAHYYLENLNQL